MMIKKSIYLVITLFVILIIGILPLTNLPVSASSRGVIRSQTENTKIVSVVGGRVIANDLTKKQSRNKAGRYFVRCNRRAIRHPKKFAK